MAPIPTAETVVPVFPKFRFFISWKYSLHDTRRVGSILRFEIIIHYELCSIQLFFVSEPLSLGHTRAPYITISSQVLFIFFVVRLSYGEKSIYAHRSYKINRKGCQTVTLWEQIC